MPTQADEILYLNAVKWINDNPRDNTIPDMIKRDFLIFITLQPENKAELLLTLERLLTTTGLPEEIKKALPWMKFNLNELPAEIIEEIGAHLKNESDLSNLVSTSKRTHTLFHPRRVFDKFLQQVAYGEQDHAERLFTDVYQGQEEKIQEALCWQGRFTDYSGRTFHSSAYEYAYWAKDTHMCRMLERYMNVATKEQMLARINELERIDKATGRPVGLRYKQNGAEHRSAHFDLKPLIAALQERVNVSIGDFRNKNIADMKIGMAQRDVPAHVAQEYCRQDRSFYPLPSFNVDREDIPREILPRFLIFTDNIKIKSALWFPLKPTDTGLGLGFDFLLIRADIPVQCLGLKAIPDTPLPRTNLAQLDLQAIRHLDKVRTDDLAISRDHLKPPAAPSISM